MAQINMGARDEALANATTALSEDTWAIFNNPANLPDYKSTSFYIMRYFGLSELTDYAVELAYPTKLADFGLGAHTYGFNLYHQTEFRLGFRRKISSVYLGMTIDYTAISLPAPYGSAGAVGIDLGMVIPIIKKFWLGAYVRNINQPELGKVKEKLPQTFSAGMSYDINRHALFVMDVFKDVDFPLSARGGIEIRPVKIVSLRAGITTQPTTFTTGLGISEKTWTFNFVATHHEVLGWSPGLDFKIRWK